VRAEAQRSGVRAHGRGGSRAPWLEAMRVGGRTGLRSKARREDERAGECVGRSRVSSFSVVMAHRNQFCFEIQKRRVETIRAPFSDYKLDISNKLITSIVVIQTKPRFSERRTLYSDARLQLPEPCTSNPTRGAAAPQPRGGAPAVFGTMRTPRGQGMLEIVEDNWRSPACRYEMASGVSSDEFLPFRIEKLREFRVG